MGVRWLGVVFLAKTHSATGSTPPSSQAETHIHGSRSGTVFAQQVAEGDRNECAELCGVKAGFSSTMLWSGWTRPDNPLGCGIELTISIEEDARIFGVELSVSLSDASRSSLRLRTRNEGLALQYSSTAR